MYVYIFPKLGVWAESMPSLTWKCGAVGEKAGFYFHDNYFVYNTAGCHVWRCIGGGCVCFFVFQAFSDSYRTALHVFRLKLLHTQHSSIHFHSNGTEWNGAPERGDNICGFTICNEK